MKGRHKRSRTTWIIVGRTFLWLSLAIALFIVFGAIEPFNRIGIWLQSEPVIIGRLIAATIGLAGVLVLVTARCSRIVDCLCHPLALIPLVWAAWGFVTLPFASIPLLSVFGSPELGEGILSQISLAIFVSAFLYVKDDNHSRRIFGIFALVAIILTASMTLSESTDWMPFYFRDFLAFYAAYFAVVSLAWFSGRNTATIIGAVIGAVIILIVSDNRTAWVAAIIATLLSCALYLAAKRLGPERTKTVAALTVGALPVIITLAIMLGARFGIANPEVEWTWKSVFSRAILIDVVADSLRNDPWIAFVGIGWGHFTELLLGYMPSADVELHSLGTGYFWDATWRGDFHSHNGWVEAFSAGGTPGLLIALSLAAAIPFFADPRHRILAAGLAAYISVLGTAWFEMPSSLPILAMAMASVAACPTPTSNATRERFFRWATLPTAGLAGMLAAATVLLLVLAINGRREAEINLGGNDVRDSTRREEIFPDYNRGPAHFSWLLRHQVEHFISRLRQGDTIDPSLVARTVRYLRAADARAVFDRSARLTVDRLLVRSEIAFAPKPLPDDGSMAHESAAMLIALREYALTSWPAAVANVLKRTPARTDLLAPYFFWLLDKGKEGEIRDLTDAILAHNPDDAVALWFSGLILLESPATRVFGFARLNEALAARIERVFPVSTDLKQRILNADPGQILR